jgi:hypothetical protein
MYRELKLTDLEFNYSLSYSEEEEFMKIVTFVVFESSRVLMYII